MIDRVLFDWAPAAIAGVVAIFLADYFLTHLGARASQNVRERWSVEGSYEMNPTWERQIDSGRWFSWRVPAVALLLAVTLGSMRVLLAPDGGWFALGLNVGLDAGLAPAVFGFAVGLILLLQVPVLYAHATNLQTFRDLADPIAAEGGVRYRRWFIYRQGAGHFLRFAVLWLVLWLPSQQAFFLGGVVSCVLFARRLAQLGAASRAAAKAQAAAAGAAARPAALETAAAPETIP